MRQETRAALMAGSAIAFALMATPGLAQTTADTGNVLGEVVVTATRQADTVSHVALSITAVTQKALDQQNVASVTDFTRTVPSITFRGTGTSDTSISIRGVVSGLGAATTGVYLDDTPLQKRLANGITSGNGNAYPQLFDLERIEVLRGPQGTLYGGSSEGGTIRFITPSPSLTRYSVYARAEASETEGGAPSLGGGVAVGGPIVQDKLGFRFSVEDRHNGGYIDHVSLYDAHTIAKNTNGEDLKSGRLAVTWAPTEHLKITPSIYLSRDFIADSDTFWENVPQYKVAGGVFNNSGTIYGVPYKFPNVVFPAQTQGPFNQFGPFKTPVAYYPTTSSPQLQTSPRTVSLGVGSLTIDYDFPLFAVKSITSSVLDSNKGYNSGQFGLRSAVVPPSVTGACGQGQATLNYAAGCAPLFFAGFPQQYSEFYYENTDHVVTQEIRLNSLPNSGPFSWVGGVFYSDSHFYVNSDQINNEDAATLFVRGVPEAYFVGQRPLPGGDFAHRAIVIHEQEVAGFGELNYMITSKLKATAGVRISRHLFDYKQTTAGPVFAPAFGFTGTAADPFPNATNGANGYVTTTGSTTETPVTPKFGLSYQLTDKQLFYVTAAEGYRAGGVNVPANPVQCAAGLAAIGGTPPNTYTSDSVWSYEAGSKSRIWGGRAQIDASIYHIDWKSPQISQSFPTCGYSYIANAGGAVSQGADLQTDVRLFPGFTLSGSVAYTDAHYTQTVKQPGGTSAVVNKGDELGAPKWEYNIGGRYDFTLPRGIGGYVRADYRFQSDYQRGGAAGTTGYDPITARGGATHYATARAGVTVNSADISLFVNNLTNSRDLIQVTHGAYSPLVTASTFRPREVGLQVIYRY